MVKKIVTILNETGLHARPAAEFVQAAKTFKSAVTIRRADEASEPVNAKSMVRLLTLALSMGTRAEIAAEGEDEQQAVDALAALINSGFGELA